MDKSWLTIYGQCSTSGNDCFETSLNNSKSKLFLRSFWVCALGQVDSSHNKTQCFKQLIISPGDTWGCHARMINCRAPIKVWWSAIMIPCLQLQPTKPTMDGKGNQHIYADIHIQYSYTMLYTYTKNSYITYNIITLYICLHMYV